ncbi:unnamed protein product, partial [Polarella glacialis]
NNNNKAAGEQRPRTGKEEGQEPGKKQPTPRTGTEGRDAVRKPTDAERVMSRSRIKKRTTTINLDPKLAESKCALPPPSSTTVAEIFPSVEQALERFYTDSGFTSQEMRRIQTVFNRFARGDKEVGTDSLHQALLQLGFLMATEASVEQLAKETTEYERLDFA